MEPLTLSLAAGFVASFAMDIVKDKGPEYALEAGKALYRRLREDRPPDRDLQRAVRRAYLRAILGACDACRAELAKQGPSKDAWDVTDLGRAVEGEVRDTRQAWYQLPPWFAVDGIHLLL
jgi:hypothetical protein